MSVYASFRDLQKELISHYHTTGEKIQFHEAVQALTRRGLLVNEAENGFPPGYLQCSDEEFEACVDNVYFPVPPSLVNLERVEESGMFLIQQDVFVFRHPFCTKPVLHSHDFWEIEIVLKGECTLYFEEEKLRLGEGSIFLVAPGSHHEVETAEGSNIYCIMLRKSTFEANFFSLLSRDDALALFFRTNLKQEDRPNYLLFRSALTPAIRFCLRNAVVECYRNDIYSNSCCISSVNILFASMLRAAGDNPQFYRYEAGNDFTHILHAIRHHYQTITLTELAEQFHYSKPHLSTLIRQNTGVSFTDLLKQIRMSRASDYLLNTELPVFEIAEIVGYNSADHFTRTFRSTFGCSPQEYRRAKQAGGDRFTPFEIQ